MEIVSSKRIRSSSTTECCVVDRSPSRAASGESIRQGPSVRTARSS
jgi:hypothetical protein